jgi:hypothetical protein
MEKIQSFKSYIKETIYVVTSMGFTGAFMSKREATMVLEHHKLLSTDTYLFTANYEGLGEFLTTEEIGLFKEKHHNYLKFLESKNEENTVSDNPRNTEQQ